MTTSHYELTCIIAILGEIVYLLFVQHMVIHGEQECVQRNGDDEQILVHAGMEKL